MESPLPSLVGAWRFTVVGLPGLLEPKLENSKLLMLPSVLFLVLSCEQPHLNIPFVHLLRRGYQRGTAYDFAELQLRLLSAFLRGRQQISHSHLLSYLFTPLSRNSPISPLGGPDLLINVYSTYQYDWGFLQ